MLCSSGDINVVVKVSQNDQCVVCGLMFHSGFVQPDR